MKLPGDATMTQKVIDSAAKTSAEKPLPITKKVNGRTKKNNKNATVLEPEIQAKATKPIWHPSSGFYIEENLFKFGIFLLTPDSQFCEKNRLATGGTFVEKKRKFVICAVSTTKGTQSKITVHDDSLEKKDALKYYKQAKKSHELLAILTKNKGINDFTNTKFIINGERSEEVFHPVAIGKNSDGDKVATYIYPWLSSSNKNLPANFSGFSQFVTATCMFGPSLRGLDDENGSNMPLIKHDIRLHPGQKIDTIEVDKIENSFYDQMVFAKLENLALTIKKFSKVEEPALLLHLPYWDYILFGLDLFIRGKLTLSALDSLIKQVHLRKEIYIENINEICNKYDIVVTIKSPLDSLFQSLDIKNLIILQEKKLSEVLITQKKHIPQEEPIIAQSLLETLGLSTDEKFYAKFNPPQPTIIKNWENHLKLQLKLQSELKQIINNFIKNCLEKLQDGELNPASHQIWQDLCKMQQAKFNKKFEREKSEWHKKLAQQKLISEENSSEDIYEPELEQLDNLECLLHMANASLLMEGARGKEAYETCSLLEISEKQIPATYADLVDNYSKDLAEAYNVDKKESEYAPVANLSIMEACLAYKAQTYGLLFYFSTNNAHGLAAIFADRNVLSAIGQNIYSQIEETCHPRPVSEILPTPEITISASPPNSPKKSGQPSKCRGTERVLTNSSVRKQLLFYSVEELTDKRLQPNQLSTHSKTKTFDDLEDTSHVSSIAKSF